MKFLQSIYALSLLACARGGLAAEPPLPTPLAAPPTARGTTALGEPTTNTVKTAEVEFEVPPGWHVAAGEEALAKLPRSQQEWDEQYDLLWDLALPREQMVAHAGSQPFGEFGTFFKVFVRAYVTPADLTTSAALERLKPNYANAAAIRGKRASRIDVGEVRLGERVENGRTFKRLTADYQFWFGDYSGPARFDLYATRVGEKTYVFAFAGIVQMAPRGGPDGRRGGRGPGSRGPGGLDFDSIAGQVLRSVKLPDAKVVAGRR